MDLVWSRVQMGIYGFRYKWVLGGQGSSKLKMGLRWSRVYRKNQGGTGRRVMQGCRVQMGRTHE